MIDTSVCIPIDSMVCLSSSGNQVINCRIDSVDYRYVIYYDSAVCTPCELGKMGIWRSIIRNTRDIGINVDFLFIFSPKVDQLEEFMALYYRKKSLFRIYIDNFNIVKKRNSFISSSPYFSSFLVNKENTIVFTGNPAKNEADERMYYNFLKSEKTLKEQTKR